MAQTAAELQKVADAQTNVGARVDATAKMAEAAKPAMQALAEAQERIAELRGQRQQALQTGTMGEVADFTDKINAQERSIRDLTATQKELEAAEGGAAKAAHAHGMMMGGPTLAMAAASLGFAETAKSADMLAQAQTRLAESHARLEQAKSGGTIQEVQAITDEQKNLGVVIAELTPKQNDLSLSMRHFTALVSQASPLVGHYVEALFRSVHVAGQLGAANINLNSIMKAGAGFITENANALLLMGAGGAVIFGIQQIVSAYEQMGKELENVTARIKQYQDAVNALKRSEQERQQSIETISDTRREGGLSAEQSAGAQQMAANIQKRFGKDLDEGAINEAVGMFFDKGLSEEEMAQAAFSIHRGMKVDPGARAESRMRVLDRAKLKDSAAFNTLATRVETEAVGVTGGVGRELGGSEAGTLSIEDFIANLPGGTAGMAPEKLAAIVKGLPATRGARPGLAGVLAGNLFGNLISDRLRGAGDAFTDIEAKQQVLAGEGIEAKPEELRAAEFILQQFNRQKQSGANVTINHNTYQQQGWKNYGADAAARQERTINGDQRAKDVER